MGVHRSQGSARELAACFACCTATDRALLPPEACLQLLCHTTRQDRTDREVVTPWFKFLWETYRSVMDILRNNSRLEALYAMTAAKAFQFCLTYKRTTEFRRLCDILRNHLANLNKCAPRPWRAAALLYCTQFETMGLLGVSAPSVLAQSSSLPRPA